MAKIKIIFRFSSYEKNEGTLYYRVIHRQRVRQIHIGIILRSDEWDESAGRVIVKGSYSRRHYLRTVQERLNESSARLRSIVLDFERKRKEYSSEDVASSYFSGSAVKGFFSFTRKLIEEIRIIGKSSAAEHFSSTLNSLVRFCGLDELPFERFDSRLMVSYEEHLKSVGLTPNSTSFYMRKLRSLYNQAVERELTVQNHPFRHVYTGIAKTSKRAVGLETIKTLLQLDLEADPPAALSRDMFLFSFYTRGMSMIDMAYLKKSDLRNGELIYRRHKTGQELVIRWEERMQTIVARYPENRSEYLLPIIKPGAGEKRRQYQSASHLINRHLKRLGKRIGLPDPLTMYRARHAWASIAYDNRIPVSVISQGMGHDSEKTTRIYLASLDASVVDKANNKILSLLD